MRFLIIGDGVAGHTAAVELRKRKPDADISIISDEEYPFYDRVGLKRLVEGLSDYSDLIKADKDFYRSKNIDLKLGSEVSEIDTEEKKVKTKEKIFDYDKLLIAAGGHLRRLNLDEEDLRNIYYIWNMKDAVEVDKKMEEGEKVVVIGGGFLGLEMACSLRKRGMEVDYLIREDHWGSHCVTEEGADLLQSEMEKEDINIFTGIEAHDYQSDNGEIKSVKADGKSFECEHLVVCIGLIRNTDFLEGSGIEIGRGVVTDEYLKTNKEDVYAAGDIAEFYSPIFEEKNLNGSWPSAERQGGIAARNMLGGEISFSFVNTHVINHFDFTMMTLGEIWLTEEKDTYVTRKGDSVHQIVTEEDKVVGAVLINDLSPLSRIKKAVKGCDDIEYLDIP